MKTTYAVRTLCVVQAALVVFAVGCQTEQPTAPTAPSETTGAAANGEVNGDDPAAVVSPDETVGDEANERETPDPQADVKALIENLRAQFDRPTNAPPVVPLPGGKGFVANDQGEIVKVGLAYTPTTDDDVAKLAEIPTLEWIVLTGTKVTDEGFLHLKELKTLKFVSVEGTAVTEAAKEELKQALPECRVK